MMIIKHNLKAIKIKLLLRFYNIKSTTLIFVRGKVRKLYTRTTKIDRFIVPTNDTKY